MASSTAVTIFDESKPDYSHSNTHLLRMVSPPQNQSHQYYNAQRPTRQLSVRRQLSRSLSKRAKIIQSASPCNMTACIIGMCFVVSIMALGLSLLNFYSTFHGHGALFDKQTPVSDEGRTEPDTPGDLAQTTGDESNDVSTVTPPPLAPEGCRAYAHVVGSNQQERTSDDELDGRLLIWQQKESHNVEFSRSSGLLKIQKAGWYYVYSQIYFSDSPNDAQQRDSNNNVSPMIFSTMVNRNRESENLMRSVVPFGRFSTKYHGGIFRLNVGDTLEVNVKNSGLRINTRSENSFFGVFMLSPS